MSRRDPHFDPIDEFLKNMKSRQFRRMLEQIVKQLPPAQRAEFLVQISDHIRKHVGASTPIKRRSTDHKSTGKKSRMTGILSYLGFGRERQSADSVAELSLQSADRYGVLAEAAKELIEMQLLLASMRPDASAASIGYIFGMFDCAAQIAQMEVNTPEAHGALQALLSSVLSAPTEKYFCILAAEQHSPKLTSAAMAGGNDYNNWVRSKGEIRPASLL